MSNKLCLWSPGKVGFYFLLFIPVHPVCSTTSILNIWCLNRWRWSISKSTFFFSWQIHKPLLYAASIPISPKSKYNGHLYNVGRFCIEKCPLINSKLVHLHLKKKKKKKTLKVQKCFCCSLFSYQFFNVVEPDQKLLADKDFVFISAPNLTQLRLPW